MIRLPEPQPPRVSVSVNVRMVEVAMCELHVPRYRDIAEAFLVSHADDIEIELRIAANEIVTRLLQQEYRLGNGVAGDLVDVGDADDVDVEDLLDEEDGE